MIGNLVIHVGAIKAATTSVQVALAAGCFPKTEKTIYYPVEGLNHNYLERVLTNPQARFHPEILKLRAKMSAKGQVDICILSGERLSVLPPKNLKDAVEACFSDLVSDYTILHYIRPHADQALSGYAERVKIGACNIGLRDFLVKMIRREHFLKHSHLQNWRKVFGDRYRLRPMLPDAMTRQDAVADFFNTILGSLSGEWSPPPSVNESASAAGLAQVYRLQQQLTAETLLVRHTLGYEFAERYNQATVGQPRERIGMDSDTATLFLNRHLRDAEILDQDFFGGESLFASALRAGVEKAQIGNPAPLDIPEDMAGKKIHVALLAMLRQSENREAMALRMRKARYQRYISLAKGESIPLFGSNSQKFSPQ